MLLPSRNAGPSHAKIHISAISIMFVSVLGVRLVLRRLRRGRVVNNLRKPFAGLAYHKAYKIRVRSYSRRSVLLFGRHISD